MADDGETIAIYKFPDDVWIRIKFGVKWSSPPKGFDYSVWTNGCCIGDFKTLEDAKKKALAYAKLRMEEFIDDNMPIIEQCKSALWLIDKFDWIERFRVFE